MSLMEGVGDEVVQFFAVTILLAIALLAWWSTNDHNYRYRAFTNIHRLLNPFERRSRIEARGQRMIRRPGAVNIIRDQRPTTTNRDNYASSSSRLVTLQEMDSIIDAHLATMNHDTNRIHFYRWLEGNSNSYIQFRPPTTQTSQLSEESTDTTQDASRPDTNETEVNSDIADNAQIREMDSIVNAMEADISSRCEFFRNEESTSTSIKDENNLQNNNEIKNDVSNEQTSSNENVTNNNEPSSNESEKILVKLKYFNEESSREVEASLDEPLKDFKWRNFNQELTSSYRVRLIFNGRSLNDDGATLRECGLYNRAVLYCIVNTNIVNAQTSSSQQSEASIPEVIIEGAAPQSPHWDLENVLMTLVSVVLTVVWFFRCEYSNMFTASATIALFSLTVFYSISIFGLYFSDTFHFERRPAQQAQVPNNNN